VAEPGKLPAAGVPPLASIYYNPVGVCNLRCKHCWVEPELDSGREDPFAQRDRREEELSPAQFFSIVDQAKRLGLAHVKFTGGEPFLRRDTIDMMEGAAARRLGLTVETNGTLLDDSSIARLARLPLNQVAVSLDHVDPVEHDRFRGVRGAHERALAAIGKLVGSGLRVQIIMAVTRRNVGAAAEMIALAESLRVESLKLCPVSAVGRGAAIHAAGEGLSAREFLELYRRHARPLGPGMRIHVEVPPAFRPLAQVKAMSLCRIKGLLGLLPTGDVSYCGIGMSHPELVFGNVLRDNLEGIWREHPRLVEIREGLPRRLGGVCGRCILRAQCLGVCRIHAYVLKGDLFAANEFCEEAEAQGFHPRSRVVEREPALSARE